MHSFLAAVGIAGSMLWGSVMHPFFGSRTESASSTHPVMATTSEDGMMRMPGMGFASGTPGSRSTASTSPWREGSSTFPLPRLIASSSGDHPPFGRMHGTSTPMHEASSSDEMRMQPETEGTSTGTSTRPSVWARFFGFF